MCFFLILCSLFTRSRVYVFTFSSVQAFCSFSFQIGSKSSLPPSLLPLKDTLVVQLSPLRYSKVVIMLILLLLIVAFDVHVHLSTLMATLWSSTASTSWWSKRWDLIIPFSNISSYPPYSWSWSSWSSSSRSSWSSQEDRPHPVCVDGCVYTKQGENTGDEYCFRWSFLHQYIWNSKVYIEGLYQYNVKDLKEELEEYITVWK